MRVMGDAFYDLRYDPNDVGPDLVVECWLPASPRGGDSGFDPVPGDVVRIGDDEELPLQARVVRRSGDRVWVQVHLPTAASAVA